MANLIQIKRSLNTAIPASLANGEQAYSSNGDVLFIGANGSIVAIGGARTPGTLTANQALVANATGYIDAVKTANLTVRSITANGTSSPGDGYLLSVDAGGNTYWKPAGAIGINVDSQYVWTNTHSFTNTTASSNTTTGAVKIAGGLGVLGKINVTDLAVGNDSVYTSISGTSVTAANLFATSTVNAAIVSVGTNFIANSTQVTLASGIKLAANGATGSTGQVLKADGSGVAYWSSETGDISSVTAGNGLTGGGSDGDVTLDVGAGAGITVAADSVAVNANSGLTANSTGVFVNVSGDSTLIANSSGLYVNDATISIATSQLSDDVALGTQTSGNYVATITAGAGISGSSTTEGGTPTIAVVANNGIVSNTSGVFAKAANGISVDASGINVTGGDGLVANSTGVHVGAANGITVAADSVGVNSGSTLTVNTSGVHVNSTLSITDLTLSGNLSVSGTLTTVDTTNLIVKDPLIKLANGNSTTDALDVGIYGVYGSSGAKYTGLFRDATDGDYKLFTGVTAEPTTTVDTTDGGYTLASLQAFLKSGGLVSNGTNVTITANSTLAVGITANTLSLSTALPATSGGTGTGSYTSGDLLVANTGNALSKLALGTDGYVLQSNGSALIYSTLDGGTF